MAIDQERAIPAKYQFGSDEEIANRNVDGNNPTLASPPAFVQVKPANSSANAAELSPRSRSGNLKFGSGV